MNELAEYLEQLNFTRKIFRGLGPLDLEQSRDIEYIRNSIEADLSPENLTCDGELSAAAVRSRAVFLHRVEEQLNLIL